jgi:hypothetical protein
VCRNKHNGGTKGIEDVLEQAAVEDVWTYEGRNSWMFWKIM